MRAPELAPHKGWIHTRRDLTLRGDLAGRVVLLEFWTPGRVACRHVVDDLAWLTTRYANEAFAVVGVCSTESRPEATRARVGRDAARRRVTHPVVIDDHFEVWRAYGVKAWPTFVLIDPTGEIVGQIAGEGNRMLLDRSVGRVLADGRLDRTLAGPLADDVLAPPAAVRDPSVLRFPSGVAGEAPGVGEAGWIAVADTGNDRVVLATWPGPGGVARVTRVIGGAPGFEDGGAGEASFRAPSGMAFDAAGRRLYVCDTGNHAVRMIDLAAGSVRTIAGTGALGRHDARESTGAGFEGGGGGGAVGVRQALRSPTGVAFDARRSRLLVAMSGDHRLWSVDLTTMVTRVLAGRGGERVQDGSLDTASFSEPRGVAMSSDGATAYVCEGSGCAVRAVDLGRGSVRTIVGRPNEPAEETPVLPDAGDATGPFPGARLRHPAGLALWATNPLDARGDRLLVADTRNDRLVLVDPTARTSERWGGGDTGAGLCAPAGVSVARPRVGAGEAIALIADTDGHRVLRAPCRSGEMSPISFEGPDAG